MQEKTYKKVYELLGKHRGYISTKELLEGGLTNRQISVLVKEGNLEKVAHGYYWTKGTRYNKPEDYKMIEVCLCNPKAIICAESACYYHGLIEKEPEILSVATLRSDRSKMIMNFPTVRHYYSEKTYSDGYSQVITKYGNYNIYNIDKSVCDCIFFQNSISKDSFEQIIENYKVNSGRTSEHLLEYAKAMRISKRVKDIIT